MTKINLNDIPGTTRTGGGKVIDKLGGVGGADGVELITTVTNGADAVTDVLNRFGGGGRIFAPKSYPPSFRGPLRARTNSHAR